MPFDYESVIIFIFILGIFFSLLFLKKGEVKGNVQDIGDSGHQVKEIETVNKTQGVVTYKGTRIPNIDPIPLNGIISFFPTIANGHFIEFDMYRAFICIYGFCSFVTLWFFVSIGMMIISAVKTTVKGSFQLVPDYWIGSSFLASIMGFTMGALANRINSYGNGRCHVTN